MASLRFKFILVSRISGLSFDIHWVWRHLLAKLCTFAHLCALSGILVFFVFFGISRRCSTLLDVCSTFARRCSTLLDVCSTLLDVARRLLDVCSTLLDVARRCSMLLDVCSTFVFVSSRKQAQKRQNSLKIAPNARKCTKTRKNAQIASECPQTQRISKTTRKFKKTDTKTPNIADSATKCSRSCFLRYCIFWTFHIWSIFSF